MKIRDLILEEINLMPYNDQIKETIRTSVVDALKNFAESSDQFTVFKDAIDRGNFDPAKMQFFDVFGELLETELRQNLFHLSDEITNSEFLYGVFFVNLADKGKVVDLNEIHLNIDFLLKIVQYLYRYFKSRVRKTPGFDNLFTPLDADQITALTFGLSDQIAELSFVFTHELVHIIQNIRQQGRDNVEYRSYGDNKKLKTAGNGEFMQLALNKNRTPEQETRFRKLYYASPQEIAAFSQNVAQRIIHDFGADGYQSSADFKRLFKMIPFYLKDYAPTPTTSGEQKVFNRYAKLAFNAITAYIDTKLKPNT